MIRLHSGAASSAAFGDPIGTVPYGRLGWAVVTVATEPSLEAAEFQEYTDPIDPIVLAAYGVPAYGGWMIRAGQEALEIDRLRFKEDRVLSPLFVEEDMGDVMLRVLDDGETRTVLLVEV